MPADSGGQVLTPEQIEELVADLRKVMEWRFGSVTIEVVYGKVKRIQVMISKDVRAEGWPTEE